MAYNDILYDKREAVATITINRPHAMNAATVKTYDEMVDAPDYEFSWKTFGATVTSCVMTFEPPHELGWDARGVLRAYHGWMIVPDGRGGCRVVTEECQNGIVPKLAWWYLRPLLERGHQNWVESLKRVAEGGEPS